MLAGGAAILANLAALLPPHFIRTCLFAAVVTHALGSAVAGSLNPADWDMMLRWIAILVVAPLIGLAIATIENEWKA